MQDIIKRLQAGIEKFSDNTEAPTDREYQLGLLEIAPFNHSSLVDNVLISDEEEDR